MLFLRSATLRILTFYDAIMIAERKYCLSCSGGRTLPDDGPPLVRCLQGTHVAGDDATRFIFYRQIKEYR